MEAENLLNELELSCFTSSKDHLPFPKSEDKESASFITFCMYRVSTKALAFCPLSVQTDAYGELTRGHEEKEERNGEKNPQERKIHLFVCLPLYI